MHVKGMYGTYACRLLPITSETSLMTIGSTWKNKSVRGMTILPTKKNTFTFQIGIFFLSFHLVCRFKVTYFSLSFSISNNRPTLYFVFCTLYNYAYIFPFMLLFMD